MSAPKLNHEDPTAGINEVRLVGRLSQQPEERVLPSGDVVWTFRVVIPRARSRSRQSVRQGVDALECSAWGARAQRSVARWAAGDVVEVRGALHRRFFKAAAGAASRVEVEMASGRVIRRATNG